MLKHLLQRWTIIEPILFRREFVWNRGSSRNNPAGSRRWNNVDLTLEQCRRRCTSGWSTLNQLHVPAWKDQYLEWSRKLKHTHTIDVMLAHLLRRWPNSSIGSKSLVFWVGLLTEFAHTWKIAYHLHTAKLYLKLNVHIVSVATWNADALSEWIEM